MGIIWDEFDNEDMFDEFSTPFLWFQARQSPALRQGLNQLNTNSIYGYYYNPQVNADLVRTSINYHIVNSENGRIYKGGAKIQIPPTKYVNGSFIRLPIYDQIFKGDILVAVGKPIRDFDILTRGIRDKVFAFDIKQVLSVTSVNANKEEVFYYFGIDYLILMDGIVVSVDGYTITPFGEGTFGVSPVVESIDPLKLKRYPITLLNQNNPITFGNYNEFGSFYFGDIESVERGAVSNITIVWIEGGNHPPEGEQYSIEFTCNPNYVVWDDAVRPRGTSDNDLSKVVNCVKRAYFNEQPNPLDKIKTNQKIMDSNPVYVDEQYDPSQ